MNIKRICSALSSERRLALVKLLLDKPLSSKEVFDIAKKKLGAKNRETTYRALETLAKAGILKKFYDPADKKIKYKLENKQIVIEF